MEHFRIIPNPPIQFQTQLSAVLMAVYAAGPAIQASKEAPGPDFFLFGLGESMHWVVTILILAFGFNIFI